MGPRSVGAVVTYLPAPKEYEYVEVNLNECVIPSAQGEGLTLRDYSGDVEPADIQRLEVLFRHLEMHLTQIILAYPYVLGNVAWLTSHPILEALSYRKGVSIIVQKEDLWRPDVVSTPDWRARLREDYRVLPSTLRRDRLPHPLPLLTTAGNLTVGAIRCVGLHNTNRQTVSPKAHNKFLVFCDEREDGYITPKAVWTGSFNFTRNSGKSFENALYIVSPKLALRYLYEYAQILALSEPLDWEADYVAPEWRVGT